MKFAEMIKGSIEAADKMGKMAQSAGISVESLSRLSVAAKLNDVDAQTLAMSMEKLDKSMAAAQSGTGVAAEAYKALGISVTDAHGELKSGDQVMQEVADRFSQAKDGADKTAVAIAIFGKSGAAMIPMLNNGSEELKKFSDLSDKLGLTMNNELTQKAQEVADNFKIMGLSWDAVGQKVMRDMLPTFKQLSDVMVEQATDEQNVALKADVLSTALKGVVSIGLGVVAVVEGMGRGLGGLAAIAVAVAHGELAQARLIFDQMIKDQEQANANFTKSMAKLWSDSAEPESHSESKKRDKPIHFNPAGNAEVSTSAYDNLVKSIREKTTADEQALAGESKLTEAENFAVKVRDTLKNSTDALIIAHRAEISVLLEHYLALDKDVQAMNATAKAKDAFLKIADQTVTASKEYQKQLEFENSLIGKNAEQVKIMTEQHKIQGEEEKKLLALRNDPAFKDREKNSGVNDQYQAAIALTTQAAENAQKAAETEITARDKVARAWDTGSTQAINTYVDNATNAAAQSNKVFTNAFQGMENALVTFCTTGKLNFTNLVDSILTDLIRIQIQQSIMAPIAQAGGLSGIIGSIGTMFGTSSSTPAYNEYSALSALSIPAAANGFDVPAGTNPLTQLHSSEMVLPADLANNVRSMTSSGSANATPNVTVQVVNQSGTAVTATQSSAPSFNGTDWVIGVVMDAANTNPNFRNALGIGIH